MRAFRFLLLGCSFVLLLALLWYTLSTRTPFPKPPDPRHIAAYPHAQQIQTTPPQQLGLAHRVTTSFMTADSPDMVLAFYRERLVAEGWQPGGIDDRAQMGEKFIAQGCPFSYVYVITRQVRAGETQVEVQLNRESCR